MPTYDEATLKALKESIEHWKRMATGTRNPDERVGSDDCALCGEFFNRSCAGCPVATAMGKPLCIGTPYEAAHELFSIKEDGDYRDNSHSPEFKATALKELEFLESLLSKEQTV